MLAKSPTLMIHIFMDNNSDVYCPYTLNQPSPYNQIVSMNGSNNPDEILDEGARDQVFKALKTINKNNMCIDCEKKNPKWASIHLGVQLCIDCAGKHRQYGVMYSFVKSTNLDVWNRKQILFMQKGGNQRALEYLTKCGVISENQKHIDYKSPIVQKYKAILTAEVESQLSGKPLEANKPTVKETKVMNMFEQEEEGEKKLQVPKEIPNAEKVETEQKGRKKKKDKKPINKINLEDFDTMVFDDGVPVEEKQKIVRAYENSAKFAQETEKNASNSQDLNLDDHQHSGGYTPPPVEVEKPKQLTIEQSKQKLQELKANTNIKSISSDAFKDNSAQQNNLKSNLNKHSNAKSISSSTLFGNGQEAQQEGSVAKIKDFVADASGKIFDKLSGYWNRG